MSESNNSVNFTLTSSQLEIVQSGHHRVVIEAQPGSGKTRVLVERLKTALKNGSVMPHQVVAITFTEKSAAEIVNRLSEDWDVSKNRLWISTIHGFCLRLLRANTWQANLGFQFQVMSPEQSIYFKQKAFQEVFLKKLKSKEDAFHQMLQDYGIERVRENIWYLFGNIEKMQDDSSSSFLNFFNQIQTTYQFIKSEKNLVDYDDLLFKTRDLLKNFPDVCETYQRQFRLIMVDEFQDTDPIQAEIVHLLTTEIGVRSRRDLTPNVPKLMIVGDPKQSIYRFRGADLDLFYAFKEDILKSQGFCFHLLENFRSHDKLIEFTNILFDKVMDQGYVASVPVRKCLSKTPAIEYWTLKEKLKSADARHREALWMAKKIKADLKENPNQTVSILLRAMTYADLYESQLKARKIPYVRLGATKYFQNPNVQALMALLKWALNPKDKFSYWVVLKAKWGDAFQDRLSYLQQKIEKMSLEAWFRIALDVPELSPFFEVVRKFELENKGFQWADFLEYTRWLDMASAQVSSEQESETQGKVQIMTIHQAKGLEFDTVYLPDLSYTARNDMPSLLIDKKLGVGVKIFKNMKHVLDNETYQAIQKKEKELLFEESKRLFYVAITRAKEKLVLSHGGTNPRSKSWASILQEHQAALAPFMTQGQFS